MCAAFQPYVAHYMTADLTEPERKTAPTVAAARALTDLVDTARILIPIAEKKRRKNIQHRLGVIVAQLDAARTRLIQEGGDYIDPAWAYVDAGRRAIGTYRVVLEIVEP
jgi:hypothetical protein